MLRHNWPTVVNWKLIPNPDVKSQLGDNMLHEEGPHYTVDGVKEAKGVIYLFIAVIINHRMGWSENGSKLELPMTRN